VPQAALRLISIGKLADMNLISTFSKDSCQIVNQSGKTIATGSRYAGGLYTLNGHPLTSEHAHFSKAATDLETWHRRLGHVSYTLILHMANKGMALGMPTDLSIAPATCEHWIIGKQTKTAVSKVWEGVRSKGLLNKVFLDITWPKDVPARGKYYALHLVDNMSRKTWLYLPKRVTLLLPFRNGKP